MSSLHYLRLLIFFVVFNLGWSSVNSLQAQDNYLRYVNNFIGTTDSDVPTKWGSAGGLYPGAVAPFGYIQITPQTHFSHGYNYKDSSICFFSCVQHKSGYPGGSAGHVFVTPVKDADRFQLGKTSRSFRHTEEIASPGYYKVTLSDNQTIVEATSTVRCGFLRFVFPAGVEPIIFIGDAGKIQLETPNKLSGSMVNTVFEFNENYENVLKQDSGIMLHFPYSKTKAKIIILKIATSSVSEENAQKNKDAELGTRNFDEVKQITQSQWREMLSSIEIQDGNKKNKQKFYTALYHSLLLPWIISDVDGSYKGREGIIHQTRGKNEYGQFSPWDTFRSLHPLLCLIFPERQSDMVQSALDLFSQQGSLPTGTMTGNHMVPVIVDSYLKGITNFDTSVAWRAMKRSLLDSPNLQRDIPVYRTDGYLSSTYPESVTRTMEYAYDDWAAAEYLCSIGNKSSAFENLSRGANNYRNLFYPETLFFLPRDQDRFSVNPGTSGYKEGDKWVYSYFVPQHTKDLINLMGGDAVFTERLDFALAEGKILFDNETVFHIPYLFNDASSPHKTQEWIYRILNTRFNTTPGGMPGNDDMGSMSSWFVFSSMGFFPTCPGLPKYSIGFPLFDKVVIHTGKGKDFIVQKQNKNGRRLFIQSLFLNGTPSRSLTIDHSTILHGGQLTYKMSSYPSDVWFKGSQTLNSADSIGDARFEVMQYRISKSKTRPYEPLTIYYEIKNPGSSGTKQINLFVNGHVYARKNCFVRQGEMVSDSIVFRLYPVGKTIVGIEKLKPGVVEVMPALHDSDETFIEIMELKSSSIVRVGEPLEIRYSIKNIDGFHHAFDIPVKIDGMIMKTTRQSLEPGETKCISFFIPALQPGLHVIEVLDKKNYCKVFENVVDATVLDLKFEKDAKDSAVWIDRSGFSNQIKTNSREFQIQLDSGRFLFDKNSFVDVEQNESLELKSRQITMMLWVYPKNLTTGYQDIFTKGDNQVIQVSRGKRIVFFAGGWGIGDCGAELPENWLDHWHHLAGVCDGRNLRLYIDGELKAETSLNGLVDLTDMNRWTLGRNAEFPGQRVFTGYMDKIKIFSAPLNAEDIKTIMNK